MRLPYVTRHGDIRRGSPWALQLIWGMRRVVAPCIYCTWKRSDLGREGYARMDITAVFLFWRILHIMASGQRRGMLLLVWYARSPCWMTRSVLGGGFTAALRRPVLEVEVFYWGQAPFILRTLLRRCVSRMMVSWSHDRRVDRQQIEIRRQPKVYLPMSTDLSGPSIAHRDTPSYHPVPALWPLILSRFLIQLSR